jgi:hypothetical protein
LDERGGVCLFFAVFFVLGPAVAFAQRPGVVGGGVMTAVAMIEVKVVVVVVVTMIEVNVVVVVMEVKVRGDVMTAVVIAGGHTPIHAHL